MLRACASPPGSAASLPRGIYVEAPSGAPTDPSGSQQPSCPLSSYADTWLRVRLTRGPIILARAKRAYAAKTGRLRMLLGDAGCKMWRTENPRVGGSIPPLATMNLLIFQP